MKKLVWKFQTNRTKNEEVIAYTSWVVVWREVYINRPYRLASHTAYKGVRAGVMVKCIAFSYGSCLLMLYLRVVQSKPVCMDTRPQKHKRLHEERLHNMCSSQLIWACLHWAISQKSTVREESLNSSLNI